MDLNSSIPQPTPSSSSTPQLEDMSILQPITSSTPQPIARSITEASTSLNEKLGKLISRKESECTIFRVHRHLREVNPSAYEPKVIAIGPYHRGKDHLKIMEDHKLRNLQSLIERKGCDIETFAKAVGELESEARKCYAGLDQDFELNKGKFIEMLVLDGCFIIELVRNYYGLCDDHEIKYMLRLGWMIVSLQRDLVLFENQIPFFILRELFDLIVGPHQHSQLLRLLSKFLCNFYPTKECGKVANVAPHEIKHILDLVHHTLPPPPSHSSQTLEKFQFITCATGLREANVKFEMKEEARMFDIEFKDGVMVMAPLLIGDDTECFLRNLIVYEQNFQHYPHNFVTEYVVFLDSLINSGKDVELLTRKGIIENWLGDDEVVAKMVNRLGDSVVSSDDCLLHYYDQICKDVNEHCRKPWNWWMAKLRRNYCHSPWAIISVLAAVVLLLLTITQTVFSILQMVEKD